MLNDLFSHARKNGIVKLEADIEEPEKSVVFSKYPKFLANHHAVHFFCGTLRMSIGGGIGPFEPYQMMELDMEVHHRESLVPAAALTSMADSLPGSGIVAAVLGVVITMGALGGPPEEIGHKVAAALVGTFLGILLCYGFIGPLASPMTKQIEAEIQYYNCMRVAIIAFLRGDAPILATEFARKSVPVDVRPPSRRWRLPVKVQAVPLRLPKPRELKMTTDPQTATPVIIVRKKRPPWWTPRWCLEAIFFQSGSPQPSDLGSDLLSRLAVELGSMPSRILIEGHTDAAPFTGHSEIFKLGVICRSRQRRATPHQQTGLRPDQVSAIRGYADQQLPNKNNPEDPSNWRISLIVQYLPGSIVPPPTQHS